ncbi:glycosyltransferase [Ornithinimicrobium cavernae]|uniref:glycosyltransferase n=1 Tax=Ornithinimicrobium cavernae TaxID=2666047 RepID=UPI0012B183F7|nr:glycosyltransferase [Ornithinimicrobium cavernae]
MTAQESVVTRLRELGQEVRWAYAEGRLPVRPPGSAESTTEAPHRLRATHTNSLPHRVVLTVAPRVVDAHRRATLAARFDPWFRAAARRADDLVVLDPAAEAMLTVLRRLGVRPRVHVGAQALRDLVDDVRVERLQATVAAAHEDLARATPRKQVERIDPKPFARLTAALDVLHGALATRADLPDPSAVRLEPDSPPLRQLPGTTRAPDQVHEFVDLLAPLLGADDPVLTAYRVRAELDGTGHTDADTGAVVAALLETVEPHLVADPAGAVDPDDLDVAVPLVCLALDVLFHRELHSDSVESPLVRDPRSHLAPVLRSRAWQLLTGATPPPAAGADDPDDDPAHRVPRRVLVLPGPYGSFVEPLADALRVSPAARVRVVQRSWLRPHLRTMGTSLPVVRQRLRVGAGLTLGGYPELTRLIGGWAPDVLVIDWADKTAVLATLLAPPHTRIVLRVHGVDVLRPWIHLLDWSRVEALVSVSAPLLDLVRDVVGERARATPAHVIPNLVDLDRFGAVAARERVREPQTLCLVGWAQRVKDPLWALEVLAALRAGGGDWRLLLVGADFTPAPTASGADYAEAFRRRAMADDVREHIEYTGFVTDLPPVLARAGFVLSSSLRESWPVGTAEAVAAGAVPVVRNWPMMAPRGAPRRLYPDEWVVDSVDEAVERIRSLSEPEARDRAASEATSRLHSLADAAGTREQLRELVLGDLGRLAHLSRERRHEEALELVRAVIADPASSPATLRQASISASVAGEQTLRLEALRRWAADDPRDDVLQLVRQQEGRLLELDPQWEPEIAPRSRPEGPVTPVPGRVLHVLKISLPHRQSGYALRSYYLLREQARAGADLSAVTLLDFPPRDNGAGDDPAGERPTEEWVGEVLHTRLLREEVPRPEHPDEFLSAFATALAEVVRERRPSVIHAHSGHRGYDLVRAALVVGRATGVPVVYEVRGFFEALWTSDLERAERGEMYQLRRAVEAHCMASADAVVTLSQSMRQDILERRLPAPGGSEGEGALAVDPERVFVVPNGVDAQAIVPRERREDLVERLGLQGAFVFGYVSNLDHPREGQELLVEAVGILRSQGVAARALIVGDGARADYLRQLAEDRGVADDVVFTGQVPHDQVGDYYALLDVFVVPRIDERAARLVTPLKPYEAMAMGLPVVVSDLPALREIIGDGERGESFPASDAAGLARTLARLAGDPEQRRRLAERGRAWVVRERTWAAAAATYEQVYATVRSRRSVD